MQNDMAISSIDNDKLELKSLVIQIANGIKSYDQIDNFTISIEGQWGIGKTSLIQMVMEELKKDKEFHDKFRIWNFSPWLINDVESLVSNFFNELLIYVRSISTDAKTNEFIKDVKKLVNMLSPDQFSIGVSETKLTWKKKPLKSDITLDKQKKKINEYLRKSKHKIIIIIDDIDRLSDDETETLFRLIKGVADLDNLIYILLFDKIVVAESLGKYKSGKGEKYLDKIVQHSIPIPKPISSYILEELQNGINEILSKLKKHYYFDTEAWSLVYGELSKHIRTLRDVKRLLNAIRFEYVMICEDVNFVDYLVITLIRLQNNELHEFIKENSEHFIKNIYGGLISDADKRIEEIIKVIPCFEDYVSVLSIIFPIFSQYITYEEKPHIRKSISDKQYFEYYFFMKVPKYDMSHIEYIQLYKYLIDDYNSFNLYIKKTSESKQGQFFQILKDQKILEKKDLESIVNCLISYINENRFVDFKTDTEYSIVTMKLVVFNELKNRIIDLDLENILELLKRNSIDIYIRLHVLEDIRWDDSKFSISDQEELKHMLVETLKNSKWNDIKNSLSLNGTLFLLQKNNFDFSSMKDDFKDDLFNSKEDFFSILEQFLYKAISIPQHVNPYKIDSKALNFLIDIEDVKKRFLSFKSLTKDEIVLKKYFEDTEKRLVLSSNITILGSSE